MPTATIAQARRWLLAATLLAALLPPAPAADGEVEKVTDLSAFIRDYLGADAKKEKFQFAVISDAHVGSDAGAENNFRALLNDIRATGGVDFVVSTGDMTEGKAEDGRRYMEIFREILAQRRHVAVMGNHDGKGAAVMQGLYGIDCAGEAANCNYSFDYGKLHFTIVHDGQRELLDPINRKFLAADLAAARERPTLLFYHVHVMCPSPGQAHLAYMGDKRYQALEFLNGFPQVQGCFAGHDHAFWHGRYMDKNFFSTVGSWYQMGTRNGWWWLQVDGEKITVLRKQIGKPAEAMPAWEKFPPYPTAMLNAETRNGRLEIPLFAEKLTGAGYYWGTQGYLSGRQAGVEPVAGEKMICCMELGRVHQGVLGCQDYKVNPGDRLAYWMFVPPGAQQWDVGVRVADRRFGRLRDQNGLPAIVNLGKAGVSPGNWLYREIPLGGIDRWFSTFTAGTPGRYASWPTQGLHSSWRLFLDEVCLLRQADGAAAAAPAPPPKVEKLKAETVGAGYVVLAWEKAAGAHHYRVQRAEGGEKKFIGTSPTGRFFDFTVRPETEYEYAVTAVNAALAAGPAGTVAAETARSDPPPAKVTGLKGALLPKGRFVFAGTWHPKPAVHISWDGKENLNDLSVRAYRVYRVLDGEKKLFSETIGRYALVDEGKLGDTFAVAAVNHAGQEGPPAELQITQTWKGPGEAFHLRTGSEDAGK